MTTHTTTPERAAWEERGITELEEDEGFVQATTRPEFDWDDDITIEEGN